MRIPRTLAALLALLVVPLLVVGCSGNAFESGESGSPSASGTPAEPGEAGTLTVGGGNWVEADIMQQMYRLLLEQAGYEVEVHPVASREIYLPALESGEVDIVPEYTATLADYLNRQANGPEAASIASNDPQSTIAAMQPLVQAKGLVLLEPAEAQDSQAYYVTRAYAEEHNLTSLSDLGALGQPVTIAAGDECMQRTYCALGLGSVYGIQVAGVTGDAYSSRTGKQKVLSGQAQLGTTGSTDGTLTSLGLVVLTDDKNLQAAENLVPLVNGASAGDPQVAEALNVLAPVLTSEDLTELNGRLENNREQKAEDIARAYLMEKGLLR